MVVQAWIGKSPNMPSMLAPMRISCEPDTTQASRTSPRIARSSSCQSSRAALKRGMGLFTGTCGAYCHSMNNDVRDAPFLFDCQWKNGSGSDRDVFRVIYDGVPGTRMVGFGGKMPEGDADIWKIVAFLRSRRESCG